ncbi:hypothetical protein JCM8547_000820 [Rhodosporidiobolus lusitaniae]
MRLQLAAAFSSLLLLPLAQAAIPLAGNKSELVSSLQSFLGPSGAGANLSLGGSEPFYVERRVHQQVLSITNIPDGENTTIGDVENTSIRGPHGNIPLRILYPTSGEERRENGTAGALIYFHGGGYQVGSVDEFERGLRIIAEESGVIASFTSPVIAAEYRLAPEWKFPTQLEEYLAILAWARSSEGQQRGIDPKRVAGGGDSAGGNMSAALTLWIKTKYKGTDVPNLKAQLLLYPEARVPFNTSAYTETSTPENLYLVGNGVFRFAYDYLPSHIPASIPYISPGSQPFWNLTSLPPAHVFTAGFDPLRDVGVEYAHKLEQAGVDVEWTHWPNLTHGVVQFGYWSPECEDATKEVGQALKKLVYEK